MDSPSEDGYALNMENEKCETEADKRIAELEEEVQRLRAQAGEEAAPVDDGGPITAAEMPYMPSKLRTVVLPILLGVIVFVSIIGLTALLSSGFDAFAKKAASSLVPDDLAETGQPGGSPAPGVRPAVKLAPMPTKSQDPPIRAPGL